MSKFKLLFLIAGCYLTSTIVQGQPQAPFHGTVLQTETDYDLVFLDGIRKTSIYEQQFSNTCRTTGNKSRLISVAIGNYNSATGEFPVSFDSVTLIYSGSRGWDNLVDEWAFDTIKNFENGYMIKSYGGDGKLDTQFYTKSNFFFHNIYKYSPANKLTAIEQETRHPTQNLWGARNNYRFYYDNNGKVLSQVHRDELYSSAPDSSSLKYGPDGEISLEIFAYGINQGWYTNYVNGKVSEIIRKGTDYFSVPMQELQRYHYVYGNNSLVDTTYVYHDGDDPGTRDTSIYSYAYDSDGYITSQTRQLGFHRVPTEIEKIEMRYNYLHQVISERYMNWIPSKSSWEYTKEYRYHYVPIFPESIAEKNTGLSKPDLQIFPIPAFGHITVQMRNGNNHGTSLRICRMDGTLVRNVPSETLRGASKSELDLSDLPAGSYLMIADGYGGTCVKQFILQ